MYNGIKSSVEDTYWLSDDIVTQHAIHSTLISVQYLNRMDEFSPYFPSNKF